MRRFGHILALPLACLIAFGPVHAKADDKKPAQQSTAPKGENAYEKKAYADPFYADIVEAAKTKSARDMVAFLQLKVQDKPERIHPVTLWLRDNSIDQQDLTKVDALYFMLYSDFTRQLALAYKKAGMDDDYEGMLKTSVMSLYVYELLASIDALRCADRTVLGAVQQDTLMPRYEALRAAYSTFTKSDFDFFATTAFIADKKFEHRKPNDYICGLGAARLSDMMRQDGVQTFNAPNPVTGEKATRVIAPPGYTFTPSYVADDEWDKRREDMKKKITKIWKDRYDRIAPARGPADTP